MDKKKLLFIAPHLSTGGMPQYLYKQIEVLKNDFEIWCVEWDNVTGGKLVVQRNRIFELLGKNLITLDEDRHHLFKIIEEFKPNVIHLQEIPEMFVPYEVACKLYNRDRDYVIVETSHDSSYNVSNKVHFPDKFMMVSQYQVNAYKSLNIPCELVEYPIEYKEKTKSREDLLRELDLDLNKKHVITVGLFTPRKNQAEVIEYAKLLKDYPIQFHFIGNQADNFKHYWEPLMKDFPSNCKWWGERNDVDTFYQIADLFLFTSRGYSGDKETMPLVIREAISWKAPSLIYNLDVYLNYFDAYDNIKYLVSNQPLQNAELILKKLNIEQKTMVKKHYRIGSRWDLDEQKIHYWTEDAIDFPIIISLKEYKSDAVLWSIEYKDLPTGMDFWILPVYKHVHDYKNDPNFTGVKICVYKKETLEQLYEEPHFTKFVDVPTMSLSHSIPYYNNYIEFFVDRKYDELLGDKKYKNVVDVGANIGVFAFYLLKTKKANNIVCVECDTKALEDLCRNAEINSNIKVIPKALYSTNEQISFYHSPQNPVISSTIAPEKLENHTAGIKGDVEYKVDTVTVKDLVDELGHIDLLKIDIEGGEYNVINNLDETLFDHIDNLFIECHFFENNYVQQYTDLLNKLRKNGYTVKEYNENQINYRGQSEVIFASKN